MHLVFFKRQGHSYIKREENQRMYSYSADFILDALKQAGFNDVEVYGEMTTSQPKKTAERIHFVCKKG